MDEKRCSKCDLTKPVSGFSKNKAHKDGLSNQCKNCDAEYRKTSDYREARRKYRTSAKGISTQKRYSHEYERSSAGKERRKRFYFSKKGRILFKQFNKYQYRKDYLRNYEQEYKQKRRSKAHMNNARNTVHRAITRGEIQPISTQICNNCGESAQEYHHHLGYAKKHWLDVIPLCKSCHKNVHLKIKK